jgi:hypothetical protein
MSKVARCVDERPLGEGACNTTRERRRRPYPLRLILVEIVRPAAKHFGAKLVSHAVP